MKLLNYQIVRIDGDIVETQKPCFAGGPKIKRKYKLATIDHVENKLYISADKDVRIIANILFHHETDSEYIVTGLEVLKGNLSPNL